MKKQIATAALVIGLGCAANGASLPHIFGDNMVLQRGQNVPVWGTGAPGEKVTVSFAGQSVAATTGADGKWRLDLAPLAADARGLEFKVKGNNEIVFRDVIVGEVWFCSGQSNMEFTMSARRKVKNWEKEVAAAKWPLIRHFRPPHRVSNVPVANLDAKWLETTPETIPPQSAVAFFFGETLHKELNVPVGLINCSWGGTRIEAWTPAGHPDDLWLMQNIRSWDRPQDVPTVLWNGMVAGLVPYAIKGAIWYQGCQNKNDGAVYLDKTISLVRGWRREWKQGDFPYFLVQLAPYKYEDANGTSLPLIQEAQAKVPEKVSNSGYTVINDLGDVNDIHPTDKRTVGTRMADQVLDRVYGKFVRPWKTPVVTGVKVEGAALRVSFANAEGLKTRDGLAPTEFEIRSLTGTWRRADARIDGCDVILAANGVTEPLGVRFAAHNGSTPNLVNGYGLPAGPFRMGRACPFGAAEKLAKDAGYICVQRYDIPKNCDIRNAKPKILSSPKDVKRIGYLLELEANDGDTSYVFAEMDAFASDIGSLVLDASMADRAIRTPVKHLKVRTNVSSVKSCDDSADGFIEFYGCNYSPTAMGVPASGDTRKYDFNDTPQPNADKGLGYGCLQLHDLKSGKVVFAFNHFNSEHVSCDVGIGNSSGEHPDWTFSRSASSWKSRRISIWAK